MNEVCISLSKIFHGNNGCENTNCIRDGSSQIEFGIIGVPNNNYNANDDKNILLNIEKFCDIFTAIATNNKSSENDTDTTDSDINEFKDSNRDELKELQLDLKLHDLVDTFKLKRKQKIRCITCILFLVFS